jgi:sulfopyruvate decarboxylase subunit alpha
VIPEWAVGVCEGLVAAGCREIVYVPDNPLSHLLRALAEQHPGTRATLATREEEAFGIAAGLYLGGARTAVMLQSSGLGNSLNAIGSLLLPYEIPVLMIVSMRGEEGEWNAAQGPMGRAVRPVLDAFAIPHIVIADARSAGESVRQAADRAFASRRPVACLLPRALTSSPGGGA